MTIDQGYKIEALPSGLRFCLRHNSSNVAYCAMTIGAGTRDEDGLPAGTAHMTEHMLFRGTERRTPLSIDNCLEKYGGDLNAYTAKEETVINATVLQCDIRRAIDLLMELAFRSEFDADELEKEKTVVMEEISSFADDPSDNIFDRFEELLFKGHPLSGLILGNAKSVRSIKREDLIRFRNATYTPDRIVLTVEADMDENTFRKVVERSFRKNYFGSAVEKAITGTKHNAGSAEKADSPDIGNPFSLKVSGKHHQVNCIIGCSAYSLYDERRFALILLCNMLGGPESGSILNNVLRERNALVYTVESNYTQYADTGVLTIYFGCEKGNLEKCIKLVRKTLEKTRKKVFGERTLKAAKRQLLGQLAIAADNGETQVLSMGKSIMSYNHILSDSKAEEKINSITSEQISEAAREILATERMATLIYQ
ncbi:MAG: insulinase family protein [Bacteroidales bacterium]|jgi:predicted Zn-dependent peptidase|nr:insulinase family protein [Bacteroidales bacterium]